MFPTSPPLKTIVVTGATSGIGLATAEALAGMGVFVIGVGRSAERARSAEMRLRQLAPSTPATYLTADLSSQREVRSLAGQIKSIVVNAGTGRLDGLVNNAGTLTFWMALTAEGFEMQWAVNHLAPFLLTHELLPLLQAAPEARIVTVSSGSHHGTRLDWNDIQLRRRYSGLRAYGQTKLANILFTMELNARFGSPGRLRAFAADPGLVKTEIGFKGTPPLAGWVWGLRTARAITPEKSARGIVYLVTQAPLDGPAETYWRHGVPRRASREALDFDAAARLWALSHRMCGLA